MLHDNRLDEIFILLDSLNLEADSISNTVLDIGIGKGEISKYFSLKNFKTTAIGLELSSYMEDINILKRDFNISIYESSVENMLFKNNTFDIIILSHVLEHCPNVGIALSEVKRVLKSTGKVIIFVPPHSDYVCSGHIAMGWNIGQLMYTLLVNGFDIKNGSSFITQIHSIAACVSKLNRDLPRLRNDKGDIHQLSINNFFPMKILKNIE